MMNRTILAVACVALLTTLTASAGDWPHYRGAERDAKSTDTKLLKVWPEGGPKQLWTKTRLGVAGAQAGLLHRPHFRSRSRQVRRAYVV